MNVPLKEPRNKSISMTPTYDSKSPRTVIILVDCLRAGEGLLFEHGSEGAFLLRLGSLLAGGSGGRLLLCSVVPVPEGESVSAYSIAAQTRRQDLQRLAQASLESRVQANVTLAGNGRSSGPGGPTPGQRRWGRKADEASSVVRARHPGLRRVQRVRPTSIPPASP